MAHDGGMSFIAGAGFTVFSMVFAAMLLWTGPNIDASRRDNHAEMRWRLRLRTALLIGLMSTVFGCGAAGLGMAKLLRVDFTGMRFDLAACAADRVCGGLKDKALFVVGDDPAIADLVVRGRNYAATKTHQVFTVRAGEAVRLISAPYTQDNGNLRTVAWRVGTGRTVIAGAVCHSWGRVRLCRQDASPAAPPELKPGQTVHVSIYDLRRITPQAREQRLSWPANMFGPPRDGYDFRPLELRSFDVALDSGGRNLTLRLDDPERATAGTCERPNMLLMQPVSAGRANGSAVTTDSLAFRFLGARSDEPYAPYSLSGGRLLTDGVADFCRSAWQADVASLTPNTDPGFTFTYHKFEIPWCLFMMAVAALLFVHVASETRWTQAPIHSVLTALVQYLLVVRALIGVRGVFLDTEANLSEIGFDAGASLISLPIVFMALRPVRPGDWKTDIACLVMLGLAATALQLWAGAVPGIYWAIFAMPVVALAWRRLWSWPMVRGAIVGRVQALSRTIKNADAFTWGLVIVIVTLVVRLGLLWLFHARERFLGLPLSPLYLLGLILGMAMMIEGGARQPGRWSGILFVLTFLLAIVAVPVMVHDNGVALTVIIPFAAVALWRVWTCNGTFRAHRLWWLPLPAYAAMFGLFLCVILLHRPPEPCPVDQADPACLEASLRYAESLNDKNLIRVMALFTPGDVPKIGTSDAMESAQQVLHLTTYGGSLAGHGYLAPISSWGNLRDVHFSDNLSAIHLIYPLGRMAAIALLSVIFAAVLAVLRPLGTHPSSDAGWRRVAAQLALWTFFGTGAYMILANLLLVPFTGRNIYLLAMTSIGDLVEGAALLALACITLTRRETLP